MRGRVGIAVLLALAAVAAGEPDGGRTAEALAFVQRQRDELGAARLERRPELDRVAAARIRSPEGPLRATLEAEGVHRFRVAWEYLDVRRNGTDGEAFARLWRSQAEAWRRAMDPAMDEIGLATTRTNDYRLVLVAVLLDRSEPLDREALARVAAQAVDVLRAGRGLPELQWDDEPERLAGGARRSAVLEASYAGPDDPVAHALEAWSAEGLREKLLDPGFTRAGVTVEVDEAGAASFVLVLVEPFE